MGCPFTIVVFSHDLKDIGDVRRLAGRTIEIRGAVKAYEGRPEIILSRISQIDGGAAMIPPLPKNYDVENRGHYSAGRFRPSKKLKHAKPKPNSTATYGDDVERDEPQQVCAGISEIVSSPMATLRSDALPHASVVPRM